MDTKKISSSLITNKEKWTHNLYGKNKTKTKQNRVKGNLWILKTPNWDVSLLSCRIMFQSRKSTRQYSHIKQVHKLLIFNWSLQGKIQSKTKLWYPRKSTFLSSFLYSTLYAYWSVRGCVEKLLKMWSIKTLIYNLKGIFLTVRYKSMHSGKKQH